MMFWSNHMGYGGYGLLIAGVLWIALIVLGVWLLARILPGADNSGSRDLGADAGERSRLEGIETPLAILQKRYARGELTKEEYEAIRHDLAP